LAANVLSLSSDMETNHSYRLELSYRPKYAKVVSESGRWSCANHHEKKLHATLHHYAWCPSTLHHPTLHNPIPDVVVQIVIPIAVMTLHSTCPLRTSCDVAPLTIL
jgi:hypothetical protein